MSYELKNIKVLGYTTDFQQCECCGREGLKGTVSILDLDSEVVLHFGTTCAVNADKYDSLNALAKAKKEVNQEVKSFHLKIQTANIMAWSYLRFKNGKHVNGNNLSKTIWEPIVEDFQRFYTDKANSLKPHPLFTEMRNS